jgi:hypothetical protein
VAASPGTDDPRERAAVLAASLLALDGLPFTESGTAALAAKAATEA